MQYNRKGNCNMTAPKRAAKDDHGGSGLHDLPKIAAFEEQARKDAADREDDSAKAGLIHTHLSGSSAEDSGDSCRRSMGG